MIFLSYARDEEHTPRRRVLFEREDQPIIALIDRAPIVCKIIRTLEVYCRREIKYRGEWKGNYAEESNLEDDVNISCGMV
jgi:hypothetical protein